MSDYSKFDEQQHTEETYSYEDLTADERQELNEWLEDTGYWGDDDDQDYDPDAHRLDFLNSELAEYEYDDIF
jgi:hypothetical protein